jgi:hypothetical protein
VIWAHRFILVGYLCNAIAAWMLVQNPRGLDSSGWPSDVRSFCSVASSNSTGRQGNVSTNTQSR